MKYVINGVKKTPIAKKDGTGTWMKVQVKTQQSGEQVLDLGFSVSKNVRDNIEVGDVVTGYIEKKPWSTANGKSGFNLTLNGITAEYVYDLLLKLNPDIEAVAPKVDNFGTKISETTLVKNDGWEGDVSVDTTTDEEVGF